MEFIDRQQGRKRNYLIKGMYMVQSEELCTDFEQGFHILSIGLELACNGG